MFRHSWLVLLLAGCLGACQRAGYQLQPIGENVRQIVPPAPLKESAELTMAAQPVALCSQSHQKARPTRRSTLGQLRIVRAVALPIPTHAAAIASVSARAPQQHQEPGPVAKPVCYRSRGISLLLAILSVTYFPLSLHNFYLGYYGRGIAAIGLLVLGIFFFFAGFTGALFSSEVLLISYLGVAILGGWFLWQLSDLVRIILRDLKPKNGDYKPKFF